MSSSAWSSLSSLEFLQKILPDEYIVPCMCVVYVCGTLITMRVHRRFNSFDKKGNGRLGKLAIDTLRHEEIGCTRRTMERNLDLLTICLFNSCQGKDAGVIFRLNYSIHQHTGTGCDTSSYMLLNIAKENSVPCMCAAALSLSDSK